MDSIRGILELIEDALIAVLRTLVVGRRPEPDERQSDYALAGGDHT
jgi:hypothetical protein